MLEEKFIGVNEIASAKQEFATVRFDEKLRPIDEGPISDGGGIIGFLLKLLAIFGGH